MHKLILEDAHVPVQSKQLQDLLYWNDIASNE